MKSLLGFLDRYVRRHFSDEEILQQRYRYPAYQDHRNEHQTFIARIGSLQQQIAARGVELGHLVETNQLLCAWFVKHISSADRVLGAFLTTNRDTTT